MLKWLNHLDRRWIFLLMFLAVALPILLQLHVPETTTELSQAVFNEIEKLKPGDKILLSFDYDPGSEAELGPMATSFVHQCCEKKLKIYFMALWPVAPALIEEDIRKVIQADFPNMVYGQDYVNLGYKSGNEGVIKVVITDLRSLYTTDARGTSLDQIPMCRGLTNIQGMNQLVSISAGYPGTKEWIQYAVTPYSDKLQIVSGCTGVQVAAALSLHSQPASRPAGGHQGSGRIRKVGERQILRAVAGSQVSRSRPPHEPAARGPSPDDRIDRGGKCLVFPRAA